MKRLGVVAAVVLLMGQATRVGAQHPWAASPKRGVGMPLGQPDQAANLLKLDALDVPWFYSWSAEPRSGFPALPEDTAFVPMSWGRSSPGNHASTWVSGSQAGLYDTLLGFNEPDLATQSNMSVAEALDLWPQLEATGLRLGSPAAANANNGWLADFMTGVAARGLRVDFLAVHRYGGTDAQAFLDHIDGLHAEYGLPIWITEFAVRDGSAADPDDNRFTDQQVYNFMAEVLPALESRAHVERYAWFPSPRDNPFVTSSALFEEDGQITKLGRLYRGEQELTYDSGLVSNAGFESPAASPSLEPSVWTTINRGDNRDAYAHTGRQSLRLEPGLESGQAKPGIVRQGFDVGVDLEVGETYSLGAWVFHPSDDPLTGTREGSLRIQWFDAGGSLIGDERSTVIDADSPTDEWRFVTLDNVLVPNDPRIAEVRATLWVNNVGPDSVNSGGAYFDDVVFVAGATTPLWGDYNGDGTVNAADYTVWRDGLGTTFTSGDYGVWAANFTATAATSSAAVPEPAALLLSLIAVAAAGFSGRSRLDT